MSIFFDILYHFGILIALSILSGFFSKRTLKPISEKIYQGIIFGAAAVIGMLNPVVISKGLVFDGRSVMLSIVSLFFGPISGSIAAVMAVILRVYQGGVGAKMGVSVIITSSLIGTIFFYLWRKKGKKVLLKEVFIVAFLVHIVMLLCTFALPPEIRMSTLKNIWLSVIIIYPVISLIIAKIIIEYENYNIAAVELIKKDTQIRNISNNFKAGMIYQVISNKNGTRRFTYLSESVKKLYGCTVDEAQKDSSLIYSKVYYEDVEMLQAKENKSVSDMSDFECEARISNPDGSLRWVLLCSTPKKLDDNNICWDGIEFDITKRKKIEEDLLIAKEIAEKASNAKSDFLSNMSHEIRTPLHGIFGFIDILYELENDSEKKEYLEVVKQCSNQLLDIVDDILSLAKIESGKYTVSEKRVDIFSVTENIAKIYKEHAKTKALDFMLNINNSLKKIIMIDEKSLLKILNNLLSNAIKFTNSGFILLSFNEIRENELEIIVKDTGIGINKEKQKRLFDPFDQGEHYLTKNYGGTGLGLSIVKTLVDMLKGQIVVDTEVGKGTQITITIPFRADILNSDEIEVEKLESPKIDNTIKIISAEDIEINQILLESIFKPKGWELTKVYNGKELIEKLEKGNYDVILMDIQMSEMNGFDATKEIRKNKKYDKIPIIGVSAYALEEDIKKALISGMNDYISKPLKREVLIEKIIKWTSSPSNEMRILSETSKAR